MIRLKYIGKKPTAIDNVTQSGVLWNGHGDIQGVPDRTARALLAFPDQWVLADEDDAPVVKKDPVTAFLLPSGERVAIPDSDLKKHLENMTANELRAYAVRYYGKTFAPSLGRKRLLDEVEELCKGMDPMPV